MLCKLTFLLAGLSSVLGASLSPSLYCGNFGSSGRPPATSSGHIVLNRNLDSLATEIFELTDGGNSSLSDNSTRFVIEGVAVQFNKSHFTQSPSSTPWIALFPCTKEAGNTTDLISNAQRLGAHAILAYTNSARLEYCNLTSNEPPVTIPIYTAELWGHTSLVIADELDKFFNVASNVTRAFDALKSSNETETDVILGRIEAIATNTSVIATTSRAAPEPTHTEKTTGSAARENVPLVIICFTLGLSSLLAY
ncbi:hypothetical protein C8J57DRAFT_1273430 [Mycena rebaudengoi]|nr:hypothetical protein C8J57DRAFT_1273430 [Mycena rebaudengoi]